MNQEAELIRSADRNDTAILCLHTLTEPIRGGGRPVTENKVKHLISVTDTHFVLGYFWQGVKPVPA